MTKRSHADISAWECDICLVQIGETPGIVPCVFTSCRHGACYECYKQLLAASGMCSQCRKPLGAALPCMPLVDTSDEVALGIVKTMYDDVELGYDIKRLGRRAKTNRTLQMQTPAQILQNAASEFHELVRYATVGRNAPIKAPGDVHIVYAPNPTLYMRFTSRTREERLRELIEHTTAVVAANAAIYPQLDITPASHTKNTDGTGELTYMSIKIVYRRPVAPEPAAPVQPVAAVVPRAEPVPVQPVASVAPEPAVPVQPVAPVQPEPVAPVRPVARVAPRAVIEIDDEPRALPPLFGANGDEPVLASLPVFNWASNADSISDDSLSSDLSDSLSSDLSDSFSDE